MINFSKLKLNQKLLLSIITAVVIIYSAIFTFIGLNMGPVLQGGIEKSADNTVGKYANLFKSYLTQDKQVSRSIADVLETMLPLSPKEKMQRTEAILQRTYKKHPKYRAIYVSWERKYVDPNWNKNYGRIRMSLFSPPASNNDHSNVILDSLDTYGDDVNGSYYSSKLNPVDILADPYEDEYYGVKQTVTSVFNSMVYEGAFIGSTGLDIPFSRYEEIIENADVIYGSKIFLLSNNGVCVANQQKDMVGGSIASYITNNVSNIDILDKIKNGKEFSTYTDFNGEDYYVTFYPFYISGTDTPWAVGLAMPKSVMKQSMISNFMLLLFVSFAGLLILIILIYFLSKNITAPITHITNMLKLLAKGKINRVHKVDIDRQDEIGEIIDSANTLVDNLKGTASFAQDIGGGDLETEFESLNDEDILGNALIDMRKSLQKANIEEESRRVAEEKQNWATMGYAKFGELLRNNTENMEAFTYNVISNLVKYTDSNQGAIFLLNEDDEMDSYLTMSSCYAYNRKKYIDKRIELGSNLVGQCFLEAETIYMTDIPQNYISITSGLGDANPSSLVIVPLKFNDKVFGVIELASFSKYMPYKIAFIEKLAESIASTIATVKVNLQTVSLLEESKLKSEELAAQEEEMRQNMEELQTTQEESARRELDMNGMLEALNNSYMVIELSLDADIININENAKKLLGISGFVEGQNLKAFLNDDEIDGFNQLWERVLQGEAINMQHTLIRSGKTFIVTESYTPIYNDMEEIYKILNIGVEIEK